MKNNYKSTSTSTSPNSCLKGCSLAPLFCSLILTLNTMMQNCYTILLAFCISKTLQDQKSLPLQSLTPVFKVQLSCTYIQARRVNHLTFWTRKNCHWCSQKLINIKENRSHYKIHAARYNFGKLHTGKTEGGLPDLPGREQEMASAQPS